MPYIDLESRAPYDQLVSEFVDHHAKITCETAICFFVMGVARRVYGVEQTRYYKQNEVVGVLACATNEWRRRTMPPLLINYGVDLSAWRNPPEWIDVFAARAASELISCDDSARAGHLNYLITKLLVEAVAHGRLDGVGSAFCVLESLQEYWYYVVVGPYEDGAIAKNGDVFGPVLGE